MPAEPASDVDTVKLPLDDCEPAPLEISTCPPVAERLFPPARIISGPLPVLDAPIESSTAPA